MKKTNKISLLLPLILVSSTAYSAPYISGQLGVVGYGNNAIFKNLFDNDDQYAASGRVAAGYLWDINNCLKMGLETGFTINSDKNLDTVDFWNNHIDVDYKRWSADLLGVVDFYATERFDLFAKAGVAYVSEKVEARISNPWGVNVSGSVSNEKYVPKAVIGAGYNVTNNVNLNVSLNHEFDRNSRSDFSLSVPGATSVLAGIKYTFS
ncbi:MAG: outer membrane protein [Candidatus Berkiellales bacterium]